MGRGCGVVRASGKGSDVFVNAHKRTRGLEESKEINCADNRSGGSDRNEMGKQHQRRPGVDEGARLRPNKYTRPSPARKLENKKMPLSSYEISGGPRFFCNNFKLVIINRSVETW